MKLRALEILRAPLLPLMRRAAACLKTFHFSLSFGYLESIGQADAVECSASKSQQLMGRTLPLAAGSKGSVVRRMICAGILAHLHCDQHDESGNERHDFERVRSVSRS
jgi:hypothetical protein